IADHRGQLGRRSEGDIGHNCRSFEEMRNELGWAALRSSGFPRARPSHLHRAGVLASLRLWQRSGPRVPAARSRDFITAGTGWRLRITHACFSRSRPPEAAFVFHAIADPRDAEGGAASNIGGGK